MSEFVPFNKRERNYLQREDFNNMLIISWVTGGWESN